MTEAQDIILSIIKKIIVVDVIQKVVIVDIEVFLWR